ncbi:MAG: orotidine-5'-phosphate decarboxylase [Candidatus Doudnabacteria bacterium]|nr:orotidine-5'-phosphate decarboxylase [Candidatus Doudnabacteria bacterium]
MTREDARSRIIVALDVNSVEKAIELVSKLKGKVGGFKIGFEFIYSMFATLVTSSAEVAHQTLDQLRELFANLDHQEFLDGKIADIGNTVAGACKAICRLQPLMFNVHAFAGEPAMKAARKAVDEMSTTLELERKPLLLAVTVLTSLGEEHLIQLSLKTEEDKAPRRLELVIKYAMLAQACGCDGVIASPLEVSAIRTACGPNFLIFTPGVRLPGSSKGDQVAVSTPGNSILDGATGVVVGRDITGAEDVVEAAERVIDNILTTVNEQI